jgi:hypothetical protein
VILGLAGGLEDLLLSPTRDVSLGEEASEP